MAEIASFGVNVDQNTRLAQNAQDTANDANKKNSANSQQIANINDPNYLTPFEKPQLEIQMDNFATIYKTDKDIATAEGIDFTAYDAAYQAYLAYMKPLTADISTYSPIVRTTFNSLVVAVQNAQKAFNAATQAKYDQDMDKAKTDIANGQSSYAAMKQDAATMKSNANSVATIASAAISSAGFANDTASTASQAANDAKTIASQAANNVAIAKNDASSAVATANSTASEFGKVDQKADSAFDNAMSAQSDASDAVKQASSAAADSKDAKQIAGAVSQSYKTLTDGSTMTIAELENGLAAKLTKTDLDGYATQTWTQNKIKVTADDISGNLSSVKKTVDGQTTSINDLKADSSGFKAQFTTVNDTLGKQNTDIGTLQATSKSLSANFDSLSSDNKTNQHDIGQLQASAKGFSSTLETVQTQVNNSAVGTNLLLGTKYFDNLSSWADNSNWNIITDTYNGLSIVQANQDWSGLSQYNQVSAGETYTFSMYARYVSGTGTSTFYTMLNNNPENGHTAANTSPSSSNVSLTSDWQRVSITFTITSDGWIKPRIERTNNNTNTLQICGMKLEKGSVATDWCPNPADNATVTAVSKLSQTVDGMQTDIGTLQADSSGFKTQFTTVNDTLGKQTTDIGTLQTDSSGFKTQFQTVNDTLGKHTTDIGTLQATSKGIQASVNSKASSDQLTLLSDQLTNKISDLSSSTSSKFTQTSNDINGLVKKGDVVNQFNLDAGGALLDTSGSTAKIILSSNNIELDSANPVVMGSANITNLLTSKTIEASSITSTTKIIGSDIQAAMIHSADNSFSLDKDGNILGASIGSSPAATNAWNISKEGKISGASVTSSLIDITGDGSGPNFDAENVTPDTATGIYSRYKYTNPNVGFDVNGMGRKMYKNGYLVINGDTFLNRTIGDWSADGGGKYVYDTMYEANVIKMRAYNYTGSNVQTDDPSKTQGVISSRLDIQPSAITMGPDFSVGNPNILIDGDGLLKVGSIAINGNHSMGTTDGSDMYFMKLNKDATDVSGTSIPIHAARYYTANMGISGGHVINSYDGHDVYLEDKWGSGGNMVSLHVKKLYNSSLLSLKTDITTIDPNDALETIANTDFRSYRFKTDDPSEPKSVSPILDDENQIPKYNTPDIFKSADGKSRNDGNILGYTALSVQALYAKIKDLTARLQKLEGAN